MKRTNFKQLSNENLIEVKSLEVSSETRLGETTKGNERERERETRAFSVEFYLNIPSSKCSRLSPVPDCTAVHDITTRGHRAEMVMVQLDCGGALYFKASMEKDSCNIFLAFSSLTERLCAYCLF